MIAKISKDSSNGAILLRFIAIILVINSHMDILYPIPQLATGGAIGNALFFMLSSYGLLLSEQERNQTFTTYFAKRIKRIYPPIWINIIVLIIPIAVLNYFTNPAGYVGIIEEFNFNLKNPLDLLRVIFYPPPAYWFLQALMLFYLMGFVFIKNYSIKKLQIGFAFLVTLYIYSYSQFSDYSSLVIESTMTFKLIFYALIFLLGIYFASINNKISYKGISDYCILFFLVFLIYFHKILMYKEILGGFQFIQQLLILPLLYYFLKISKSNFVLDILLKPTLITSFISIIAAMTLELYMVHGPIRMLIYQYLPKFPENVFLYLPVTFFVSYGLYQLNKNLMFSGSNKANCEAHQ
ncbi:acyltransferase [Crenothrix sp.]|uniref:acyltransferase family protein n=1 Tax=Crenothrix sp. TaxID=3100433 RepID=UPI00374DA6A4